jgi:hypothetical protein
MAGIFTIGCLCLFLNNQRSYRQMDGTVGFSAPNRFRINPPRSSEFRLVMVHKGVKIQPNWAGIFTCGSWNTFASSPTTRGAMGKQRLQLGLAHQIGPEIPFHGILIWWAVAQEVKKCGRNFLPSEIGDVLNCTTTTSHVMVKQMVQADSAHQIGLKPTLHAVLIVGCWCCTRR